MRYKSLTIILSILLILSWGLFIFWQRADIFSFWEKKFSNLEPEEFDQLYLLEIPPQSKYLAEGGSEKIYEALQPEEGIIVQNSTNILPGLLQIFDVKYVLLQDRKYWELFKPFLDYSPGEEKEELPRTFPVKKEAFSSATEPFLILGEGWYGLEKDNYGHFSRWFGKEATIRYVIPPGTLAQAADFLSFSIPWSSFLDKGKKAEIEVIVNRKLIYSSDYYNWVVSPLSGLQEGVNEIKLRSSQGCVVPERDDRCLSFAVQKIELFKIEDIPLEGLLRLDRFIEIEEGQYWTEADAAIRIFTLSPTPSSITFRIQAVDGKARMISLIEKDKEIKRIILFGEESQKIELLTYQQGENIFRFAADGCEEKIIEEKKQCITAQIKDLKIEFLE